MPLFLVISGNKRSGKGKRRREERERRVEVKIGEKMEWKQKGERRK